MRRVSSSFWTLRGRLTSRRPHTAMYRRWAGATGIGQRICKAHVFDETFGVNRAFNAEVFVAAPHAIAMEFDLFGERGGDWSLRDHVLRRSINSPRSGRQRKAWGGAQRNPVARFAGRDLFINTTLGGLCPAFMLSCAPRTNLTSDI